MNHKSIGIRVKEEGKKSVRTTIDDEYGDAVAKYKIKEIQTLNPVVAAAARQAGLAGPAGAPLQLPLGFRFVCRFMLYFTLWLIIFVVLFVFVLITYFKFVFFIVYFIISLISFIFVRT